MTDETLKNRELATVLACLRRYQDGEEGIDWMPQFDGVEGGPLDNEQIDALCERLNFGDAPAEAKPATPRVRMVCGRCGSEDVLKDAYVSWSVDAQDWEIHNVFDKDPRCEDCDGECSIDEVPADA